MACDTEHIVRASDGILTLGSEPCTTEVEIAYNGSCGIYSLAVKGADPDCVAYNLSSQRSAYVIGSACDTVIELYPLNYIPETIGVYPVPVPSASELGVPQIFNMIQYLEVSSVPPTGVVTPPTVTSMLQVVTPSTLNPIGTLGNPDVELRLSIISPATLPSVGDLGITEVFNFLSILKPVSLSPLSELGDPEVILLTQFVSPNTLPSQADIGVPDVLRLTQFIDPATLLPADSLGIPDVELRLQIVEPVSIPTLSDIGVAVLDLTLQFLAPATLPGTSTLTAPEIVNLLQFVQPDTIQSNGQLGDPEVVNLLQFITPDPIAPIADIGSVAVIMDQFVDPDTLPSIFELGTPYARVAQAVAPDTLASIFELGEPKVSKTQKLYPLTVLPTRVTGVPDIFTEITIVSPDPTVRLLGDVQNIVFSPRSTGIPTTWQVVINGIYDSGFLSGTDTEHEIRVFPDDASDVTVRVIAEYSGEFIEVSNLYQTYDATAIPAIVTPAPGTDLGNDTITYHWELKETNATNFSITSGSTYEGTDYDSVVHHGGNSATISGYPEDGSNVYVSLRFTLNGEQQVANYVYLAGYVPSRIIPNFVNIHNPRTNGHLNYAHPPNQLSGRSHTFEWEANGSNGTHWRFDIISLSNFTTFQGATVVTDQVLYTSGDVTTATTQLTLSDLPHLHEPLLLRLTYTNNEELFTDELTVFAYTSSPMILHPYGYTISTDNVPCDWTAMQHVITRWDIRAWNSEAPGLLTYSEFNIPPEQLSTTVENITTNGAYSHIELSWHGGAGNYSSSFVAINLTLNTPRMTSPSPNHSLYGTTVTFHWSPESDTVTEWRFVLVDDAGNTYNDETYPPETLSTTISDLPSDGRELTGTLYYTVDGANSSKTYTYYAYQPSFNSPIMTHPSGGKYSTWVHSPQFHDTVPVNQIFSWSARDYHVDNWRLRIGSQAGGTEYYDSGVLSSDVLSYTHPSFPYQEFLIYATLSYKRTGFTDWVDLHYTYTLQRQPIVYANVAGTEFSTLHISWVHRDVDIDTQDLVVTYRDSGDELVSVLNLAGDVTSHTFDNLPNNHELVSIYLIYTEDGLIRTATTGARLLAEQQPVIYSPNPQYRLTKPKTTVRWNSGTLGDDITGWIIHVGTVTDADAYHTSNQLATELRQYEISGYPLNAGKVYVTLEWII